MSDPDLSGLTAVQAGQILRRDGPNELARATRRSALRVALDVLREPMLALLLAGGVAYALLGSRDESLILLAFACLSITITVVQETRTERVLESLRDLTSPRALVIRDGTRQRIPGREVVQGDLIVLSEGDRVPADAVLVAASDLSTDESLLTGESVPVRKRAALPGEDSAAMQQGMPPGGEDLPLVFSGALVVRGSGLARVTATGPRTGLGRIGTSLATLDTATPQLQHQMRRLVLAMGLAGGAVSLAVVALVGLLRGSWAQAVLAGIAVGMSMLPEEFPMVLAVFMAMGAWRISRARVLTRRASAIESLGAASVLCTDKTGTLTENRMRVAQLWLADGRGLSPGADAGQAPPLPDGFAELAQAATLASAPAPFDPMETALLALFPPDAGLDLRRSYPVAPGLLAMTQVWHLPDGAAVAAAKGAPEAILALCHLTGPARARILAQVNAMADQGQRVLGVALAPAMGADLPPDQTGFDFRLLGLIGLEDPLRAQVPAAVADCRAAGIRVVMITGDYPATARAIAARAGLERGRVLTGPDLAGMTDAALQQAAAETTVFARIQPDQKLRIVRAFQAMGHVVAMTGDGVNDAPSLRAADIGVAMGGRGTDVAREAAALMLMDDDFGSIVTTIRLGRRIHDNLRKAMRFILAVHVPIAGLALLPLAFGLPLLLGPVHIAFLEMIIDPVCSIVFEAQGPEPSLMRRPPRPRRAALFDRRAVGWSLGQGGLVLAAVGAVVLWGAGQGMAHGLGEGQIHALAFATLVLSILGLIFLDRAGHLISRHNPPNRALAVAVPVVVGLLGLILLWPRAQAIFGFAPLPLAWLLLPAALALAILMTLTTARRLVLGSPAAVGKTRT